MLDAGQVATEVVYFLVGSRELDGGLDLHRLAQPQGLHRREARCARARSRCRATPASTAIRDADRGGPAGGSRRRQRRARRLRRGSSAPPCWRFVDARRDRAACASSLDGGNGMAGPTIGPILERLDLDLRRRPTGRPDGDFPDHGPNPLLPENREPIIAARARERRRPRDRLRRRRRPLLLHRRDTASSSPATSSPRCSPRSLLRTPPGRGDPLRRAREPGGRRHGRPRPAAAPTATASGTPSSRPRMREEGSLFGGEVSGHYYFRDFYCADSGTIPALLMLELCARERPAALGAARALPRALLHLRRDQQRGRRPAGQARRRSPSATPTRARTPSTGSRSTTTTGTSTCGRRTPSRCCACASSRSSRRRTWSAAATRCSR